MNLYYENLEPCSNYMLIYHQNTSHSSTFKHHCKHMFTLTEHFCKTDIFKFSFLSWSPRLWNSLPGYIIENTTVESFKSMLHHYFYELNS